MLRILFVFAVLTFATGATAQIVRPSGDPAYLAVTTTPGGGGVCGSSYCVNPQKGIPLNYFATSSSVTSLAARIDGELAALNPAAINAQISGINSQLATAMSQIQQTQRGLAAAAAMANIWMPSAPGKTAWAVNGAAFMGEMGAGFSVAHRLNFSVPIAITASYGSGGSNAHVGRVGLMGEF